MNWEFDMAGRTATHITGVRVRFLMRNGDWRGSLVAPLPRGVNPTHLPYLLREATVQFVAEWRRLRRANMFLERESA